MDVPMTKVPSNSTERTATLVFIHAAPRTSSTWFLEKFRECSSTLCYYEPFNHILNWLTPEVAATLDSTNWESRHPAVDPYYREYSPMLQATGGVERFEPAMTMQWFIPKGGLRGKLRSAEIDYLSVLIRHAEKADKIPTFGACRSLGRVWAIRQMFGGFHIFQYRNIWRQWLSYLAYKRNNDRTFYSIFVDTMFREDDPYFLYLVERGLQRVADPRTGTDKTASPLLWKRPYENVARDENKVRLLELLPEHHAFALFMGLHIYLYLHAQLSTDLTVDITRMARDEAYRAQIEQTVESHTGLAVSFADAADGQPPNVAGFEVASIDWDEIRELVRTAVKMLSQYSDSAKLQANAEALVGATIAEIEKFDSRTVAQPERNVKTIGLCMIVKDEAHVILRCLGSVRPLVDYVMIVDTGSTDGTQNIIRDYLAREHLDGVVIDEPWQNFSYNRNFALEELRKITKVDYALIIDADDLLEFNSGLDPHTFKAALRHDIYDVEISHAGMTHFRPQLFRNALSFSFKGVLHEYLEMPSNSLERTILTGFRVKIIGAGARSRNTRKFRDDAILLERTLAVETDPFLISRYTFYLAQSYRDCSEKEKALEHYLKRAGLGYWREEIYISLFESGNIMAELGRPFDEVMATYQRASQIVPERAEALHAAARYCRTKSRNKEGFEIASLGLGLPQPAGALFAQDWVYDYGLLDEYAISGYWTGAYRESLDASLRMLGSKRLPESMRERVAANARFAASKLPKSADLGSFAKEDLVAQHRLVPRRQFQTRLTGAPRVLLAILAKQKEPTLPLYLDCIEALDYPKASIILYIRTNNNTDRY